jgi:hypothetical protein
VKALTHDRATFLKLKSLGIDAEFSPRATEPGFRKSWIKDKSVEAGMPITEGERILTPPSEVQKMAKEARDFY